MSRPARAWRGCRAATSSWGPTTTTPRRLRPTAARRRVLDRPLRGDQRRVRPVRPGDRPRDPGRAGARRGRLPRRPSSCWSPARRCSAGPPPGRPQGRACAVGLVLGASWRHPRGLQSSVRGLGDHPVVHVAWSDIEAYAAWAGKDLPSEAEGAGARGGLDGAEFAWGDELTPGGRHMANVAGRLPHHNTLDDGWEYTAPARSFPPNGYGLFQVTGNAGVDRRLVPGPRRRRPRAAVLHRRRPRRQPRGQRRPGPIRWHRPQGHQGRLPPVRPQLLPPLSARRLHGPGRRHLDVAPRLPLHRAP